MRIILIGFMGAGKTTVGKKLATSLGLSFLDLDQFLEAETGRRIKDIFKEDGEEMFRSIETKMLRRALSTKSDIVLATGGGIITKEENKRLLEKEEKIFYLKADYNTLYHRLLKDTSRPLLLAEDREAKIKSLLELRLPKYENLAKYTVETDGKAVDEIVAECMSFL